MLAFPFELLAVLFLSAVACRVFDNLPPLLAASGPCLGKEAERAARMLSEGGGLAN